MALRFYFLLTLAAASSPHAVALDESCDSQPDSLSDVFESKEEASWFLQMERRAVRSGDASRDLQPKTTESARTLLQLALADKKKQVAAGSPYKQCMTEKGVACVFPYIYKEAIVERCSYDGVATNNHPNGWCATAVNDYGEYSGQWAKCTTTCERDELPADWKSVGVNTQNAAREGSLGGVTLTDSAPVIQRTPPPAPVLSENERVAKAKKILTDAARSHAAKPWPTLFREYDKDNSGDISFDEYMLVIREGAKIEEKEISDQDLRMLFDSGEQSAQRQAHLKETVQAASSGDKETKDEKTGDDKKKDKADTSANVKKQEAADGDKKEETAAQTVARLTKQAPDSTSVIEKKEAESSDAKNTSEAAGVEDFETLGSGCCSGSREESNGKLWAGPLSDLAACKQMCRSFENCGAVESGWTWNKQWCFVWSDKQACSSLETGADKCGSGSSEGVQVYKFKQDVKLRDTSDASQSSTDDEEQKEEEATSEKSNDSEKEDASKTSADSDKQEPEGDDTKEEAGKAKKEIEKSESIGCGWGGVWCDQLGDGKMIMRSELKKIGTKLVKDIDVGVTDMQVTENELTTDNPVMIRSGRGAEINVVAKDYNNPVMYLKYPTRFSHRKRDTVILYIAEGSPFLEWIPTCNWKDKGCKVKKIPKEDLEKEGVPEKKEVKKDLPKRQKKAEGSEPEKKEESEPEKKSESQPDKKEGFVSEKAESSGTEKEEGPGTEKAEESGTEKAEGSGTEKAEGSGTEKAEGSGTENAEGSGTENAEGSGTEKAEGSGTEKAEGSGTEKAEGSGTEKAEGSGTEEAEGSGTEKAEGSGTEKAKSQYRPPKRAPGSVSGTGKLVFDGNATWTPGRVVEPFGQEKAADQLQGHAARTQDILVDAMENAEVAEVKRTVYRTLTRLRSAQVKEYDTIARREIEAVDGYNDGHDYRSENPLTYLDGTEKSIYEDKFTSFHE